MTHQVDSQYLIKVFPKSKGKKKKREREKEKITF